MTEHSVTPDIGRCTCGGEDSDGRGDVLRCPVHGPFGGKWPDPIGFRKRAEEARRVARDA